MTVMRKLTLLLLCLALGIGVCDAKKKNRGYNRGIQMYRFPNSDVQKSVIFEGIKKRLKIV